MRLHIIPTLVLNSLFYQEDTDAAIVVAHSLLEVISVPITSTWTPWQTATASSKNEMMKKQQLLTENRKGEEKDFKKRSEMLCYLVAKNLNSLCLWKLSHLSLKEHLRHL